eukprot:5471249-Pleurochrysis_carterae.AAC.1
MRRERGPPRHAAHLPQSAGFSTIHGIPASCAAFTRRAVKSARVLCFRCTPPTARASGLRRPAAG